MWVPPLGNWHHLFSFLISCNFFGDARYGRLGFDAADGDGVVPLRKYPSFRVALSPVIGSAGLARFFWD